MVSGGVWGSSGCSPFFVGMLCVVLVGNWARTTELWWHKTKPSFPFSTASCQIICTRCLLQPCCDHSCGCNTQTDAALTSLTLLDLPVCCSTRLLNPQLHDTQQVSTAASIFIDTVSIGPLCSSISVSAIFLQQHVSAALSPLPTRAFVTDMNAAPTLACWAHTGLHQPSVINWREHMQQGTALQEQTLTSPTAGYT